MYGIMGKVAWGYEFEKECVWFKLKIRIRQQIKIRKTHIWWNWWGRWCQQSLDIPVAMMKVDNDGEHAAAGDYGKESSEREGIEWEGRIDNFSF